MLSVREAMTLTIAAATYRHPGHRDNDYTALVGMTPARAAQVIGALLDRADAEAEMPQVVRRLRRIRERRAAARTA